MGPLRLQKWISQLGIASRREAERWMEEGRLAVNGVSPVKPGTRVSPKTDKITLDGELLPSTPPLKTYWMFCKPDGVISSRKDPEGRRTIFDLPEIRRREMLFTVGRLDYHTEGLLLLSNDGELVHRLMHPSFKLPRHYYVLTDEELTPVQLSRLRKGVPLEDGDTLPAKVELLPKSSGGNQTWYRVVVLEGRNRLVRRMFDYVHHPVLRLIRYGFGDIRLPEDLQPGQIQPLSHSEVLHLKGHTDLL